MRKYHLFLVFLLALTFYLGIRLDSGLGWGIWAFLTFICIGVFVYPLNWLRKSSMSRFEHLWRWKVYLDMGVLCFLTSLVVARDLIFLPVTYFQPQYSELVFGTTGSAVVLMLALAALAFGVWVAKSGPRVLSVKVPIQDLPEGLEGYRIVQISDLHVGPTIGEKYVSKVVRKVNALAPHLTVLTGDIVDGEHEDLQQAVQPLRRLEPSGQVMYVTGNHEYYWDGPRWIEEFKDLGMNVLLNSQKIIKHASHDILVAGILDPAARLANPNHKPDLQAALGPRTDSAVKILLAHQPNIAKQAAEAGFDLLLSGHTHAGQLFPFTLFIHSVQEFVKGLKACGNMWVYVNQGTGYWGPPVRLGTLTEITLLELTARQPRT